MAGDRTPAARFAWNAAAARVAAASGEPVYAAEHAAIALRCLEVAEPPFPQHPGLGLARATPQVEAELRDLARGSAGSA